MEIEFTKKGKRQLSGFFTHELMYDYIAGRLDEDRRIAFEAAVKSDPQLQSELDKTRTSFDYLNQLSMVVVEEEIIQQIKIPTTYMHELYRKMKFDNWPFSVRMMFETLSVAVAIILLALFIPWDQFVDKQLTQKDFITLAIGKKGSGAGSHTEIAAKSDLDQQFVDEGLPAVETTPATTTTLQLASAPPTTSVITTTTLAAMAQTPTTTSQVVATGFVYRGYIEVVNLLPSTAKIVDELVALGARKAGRVELGWDRGDGTYFHMTIPEDKLSQLEEVFAQYGQLRISKDKHDRVMPDGIIRLIIDVKEKRGGS